MSDEQLIAAVAKLWVDGGGDVDRICWCFKKLREAIATEVAAQRRDRSAAAEEAVGP